MRGKPAFKAEFNNNRENISLRTQTEHTSVSLHPPLLLPHARQISSNGLKCHTPKLLEMKMIITILISLMTEFKTMFNQLLEQNGLILNVLSQVINNLSRND